MKDLKKWSIKFNALERTENVFWECFYLYEAEEPEEFAEVFLYGKENVILEFEKIVHEVALPDYDQEFVSVYLNIYVGEDLIGYFKNIFLSDGTQFDEAFVIE